MLKTILGSENAERVLLFLFARNEGYASEISNLFDVNLFGIQKQLDKFESAGILVSRLAGRTRIYQFNPTYYFQPELMQLLKKAFSSYPPEMSEKLKYNRRRPRKRNKPL